MQVEADAKQFAKDVVARLREAGYESLWAGGCVRDSLLGIKPKDYDVATSAKPDEIRELFGRKKTIAIGASFGVITVLGTKRQGQIEVATFRQDAEYSDGRHPDSVSFSNAEEDAKRRDFTINGLFYDPFEDKVIDYVGGLNDIDKKVIRAIGIAEDRIAEDKLRMLRAVRFAATYGFELEEKTLTAVRENAVLLSVVSRERVAAEIRRMLSHPNRAQAVALLTESHLLRPVFESKLFPLDEVSVAIRHLQLIHSSQFETSMAAFLYHGLKDRLAVPGVAKQLATQLNEWKFTNDESQLIWSILSSYSVLIQAGEDQWPQVQRILIHDHIEEIMSFCESLSKLANGSYDESLSFCRARLAWPVEQLNPAPILNGDDLIKAGLQPGPRFKKALDDIRDLQLMGELADFDSAMARARDLLEG